MPNDQHDKAPETAQEWAQLASLLPTKPSSPGSDGESESTLWTDDELSRSRLASIRAFIRVGYKWAEGWLTKGDNKTRPSTKSPGPQPYEQGYNPVKHSVAARLGGEYVRPGLFYLPHNGIYVDENGMCSTRGNDPRVCIGCGTARDEHGQITGGDYRWQVRTASRDPFALPHIQAWTYCRDCVTADERESRRRFIETKGARAGR